MITEYNGRCHPPPNELLVLVKECHLLLGIPVGHLKFSVLLTCNATVWRTKPRCATEVQGAADDEANRRDILVSLNERKSFLVGSPRKSLTATVEILDDAHGDTIFGSCAIPLHSLQPAMPRDASSSWQQEGGGSGADHGETTTQSFTLLGGKDGQVEQGTIELDLCWRHNQNNVGKKKENEHHNQKHHNQLVVELLQVRDLPVSKAKARRHNGDSCNALVTLSFLTFKAGRQHETRRVSRVKNRQQSPIFAEAFSFKLVAPAPRQLRSKKQCTFLKVSVTDLDHEARNELLGEVKIDVLGKINEECESGSSSWRELLRAGKTVCKAFKLAKPAVGPRLRSRKSTPPSFGEVILNLRWQRNTSLDEDESTEDEAEPDAPDLAAAGANQFPQGHHTRRVAQELSALRAAQALRAAWESLNFVPSAVHARRPVDLPFIYSCLATTGQQRDDPSNVALRVPNVLQVKICRARKLIAADIGLFSSSTSDPFVRLRCRGNVKLSKPTKKWPHKTTTKLKTLNPVWNESFDIALLTSSTVEGAEGCLELHVLDWDLIGTNDFLGKVLVPLSYLRDQNVHQDWWPLLDENEVDAHYPTSESAKPEERGAIELSLKLACDDAAAKEQELGSRILESLLKSTSPASEAEPAQEDHDRKVTVAVQTIQRKSRIWTRVAATTMKSAVSNCERGGGSTIGQPAGRTKQQKHRLVGQNIKTLSSSSGSLASVAGPEGLAVTPRRTSAQPSCIKVRSTPFTEMHIPWRKPTLRPQEHHIENGDLQFDAEECFKGGEGGDNIRKAASTVLNGSSQLLDHSTGQSLFNCGVLTLLVDVHLLPVLRYLAGQDLAHLEMVSRIFFFPQISLRFLSVAEAAARLTYIDLTCGGTESSSEIEEATSDTWKVALASATQTAALRSLYMQTEGWGWRRRDGWGLGPDSVHTPQKSRGGPEDEDRAAVFNMASVSGQRKALGFDVSPFAATKYNATKESKPSHRLGLRYGVVTGMGTGMGTEGEKVRPSAAASTAGAHGGAGGAIVRQLLLR